MKIVVAGGTGFIGEPLVRRLLALGHEVSVLTRNPDKVPAGRGVKWDGKSQGPWSSVIATADVVINLAGENIADGRWTAERKRQLTDSRTDSARALVAAMKQAKQKRTFINASAVGYYGTRGDEELSEEGSRGTGFLADLTASWEQEAREAEAVSRLVILRFGVVLAGEGGALAKMALPFRLGVGGRVGSGNQWISWIDREDLLRMIEWVIANEAVRGVYNATAPKPVTNREFTAVLARALHRPAIMPAPAFALRLAFGEMADEVLLGGQRVVPSRAVAEGFAFQVPSIEASLRNAFAK
ncbi:MAG: TIGR01777 family oxidoreductase [Thermoanaerobaculia bacterium]|nr:TIGR01777 family oxidoreductase [Thermoanaerobaculia bacterium]